MGLRLQLGVLIDAEPIQELRAAVAEDLTAKFGKGHWSSVGTVKGVLFEMTRSKIFIAKRRNNIIAMLVLGTRKPWAIDLKYFTACERPLYLTGMAVEPKLQGTGLGRACIDEVRRIAKEWPADVIRLDAYDTDAGASEFYRKCGFCEVGRATFRKTPLVYFELMT